jgi:hypothetical protein
MRDLQGVLFPLGGPFSFRNDFREYAFCTINGKEVFKMKRVLGLALVFMIFGGVNSVLAQDRCEVPTLAVGDEWTYKSAGKEIRYRVRDITGDGYLIGEGSIYDINTLNLKFRIKEGKKEESEGLLRKMFNFPLFVGKRWDDKVEQYSPRFHKRTLTYVEFNVDKQESIVTPAGNFNAFLIAAKAISSLGDSKGGRMEGWSKLWYSPQVKFWVKREYDTTFWPIDHDGILIKYKLSGK